VTLDHNMGIFDFCSAMPNSYRRIAVLLKDYTVGLYASWKDARFNISNCYLHDSCRYSRAPSVRMRQWRESGYFMFPYLTLSVINVWLLLSCSGEYYHYCKH